MPSKRKTAPSSSVAKRAKLSESTPAEDTKGPIADLPDAVFVDYAIGEPDRIFSLNAFTAQLNNGLNDDCQRLADLRISSCRQEKYVQVELRLNGPGPSCAKNLPQEPIIVLRARRQASEDLPAEEVRAYLQEQVSRFLADDTVRWLREDVKIHDTAHFDLYLYTSLDPNEEPENRDNCLDVQYATRYVQWVMAPHPALPKFRPVYRTPPTSLLPPRVLHELVQQVDSRYGRHEIVDFACELTCFKQGLATADPKRKNGTPWLVVNVRPYHHFVQVYLELRNRRMWRRAGGQAEEATVLLAQRTLDPWTGENVRAYVLGHTVLFTGQTTLDWLKKVVANLGLSDNLHKRLDPTQTTRKADGSARSFKLFCPEMSSAWPLHPELLEEAKDHFGAAAAGSSDDDSLPSKHPTAPSSPAYTPPSSPAADIELKLAADPQGPDVAIADYKFGGPAVVAPLDALTEKLNVGLREDSKGLLDLRISSSDNEHVQVELRFTQAAAEPIIVLRARRVVPRGLAAEEIRAYLQEQITRYLTDDTVRWLREDVKIHDITNLDPYLYTSLDPDEEQTNRDNCLEVLYATRYVQWIMARHPALPKFQLVYRTPPASLLPPEVLRDLGRQVDDKYQHHENLDFSVKLTSFQPQLPAEANSGTPVLVVKLQPFRHLVEVSLELRGRRQRAGRRLGNVTVLWAQRILDPWWGEDVRAYVLGHAVLFTGQTTLDWLKTLPANLSWDISLCKRLDPTQTTRKADGSARRFEICCPAMSSAWPLHPELQGDADNGAIAIAAS